MSKISKFLISILVFLLPIFFLPFFQNVLDFPKFLLLSFIISLSSLIYFLETFKKAYLKISFNWFYLPLFIFLLILLLSTLFSKSKVQSLVGIPNSISESLLSLFFLFLFLFLSQEIFDQKDISILKSLFSTSIFLLLLFSIFQINEKFILPFDFSKVRIFTLVGTQHTFAIILASLLPFFAFSFIFSKLPGKIFNLILILLSLYFLSLINFKTAWQILLLSSLFAFSLYPFFRELFSISLSLIFLIYLGFSISFLVMNFQLLPSPLPQVTLTQSASFKIGFESLKSNPFLGSGPGTFVFEFSKYKPKILNQTLLWNWRFYNSASKFLDVFSTLGILGIISFLFFALSPIFLSFFSPKPSLLLPTLSGLIFSQFLYPTSLSFEFIFFFFLSLFIKELPKKEILIEFSKGKIVSFFSALILVSLSVLMIFLSIFSLQNFLSEKLYFKAIQKWQEGKIEEGVRLLERTIRVNPRFDYYFRDLAQAYLVLAQQKFERGENILNEIQKAIENGRSATEKEKENVANWSVLGFIYQSLIGIASGSENAAINTWEKAIQLEPTNPYFFTQKGRCLRMKGDLEEAKKNFERAIELKPDYPPAHFEMAIFYQTKGELDLAISKLQETRNLIPPDSIPDILGLTFQLGLVYYQKGDYQRAKEELEKTVEISPNYANALYFLGLSYDKLGEREKAIEKFKKVSELNPDNEQVKKIIKNLEEGKAALEGISQTSQTPIQEKPPEIKQEK